MCIKKRLSDNIMRGLNTSQNLDFSVRIKENWRK